MNIDFGACYYPEHWEESDWEEDFLNMKSMGLTEIRIAEFAWSLFEPKDGKFETKFFDHILDLAKKYDLKVIIGTPTATFPPWMFAKYPEVCQVTREGFQRTIGGRRLGNYNSKIYKKYCTRIVTKLAKHYGNHPGIIGWQIDNEPGHEGSDLSYGKVDKTEFRIWLKSNYRTIENLNHRWGNIFWGTTFNSFEEIPLPGHHQGSNFNPTMIQDFYRFQSESLVNFVKDQVEILRKYTKNQFITTNLFPSPFLPVTDMAELSKPLDVISWDNYPVWGPMETPYPHPLITYSLQYTRGLKNKNFFVMEQISGQQGHDSIGYLPPPGQISLWMKHSICNGADKVYFFRYRTARFGQEQLCYGIFDHDKVKTHKYFELKKSIEEVNQWGEDFKLSTHKSEVAYFYEVESSRNQKFQPISEGFKFSPVPFVQVGFDIEMATWYAGSSLLNTQPHLLPKITREIFNYKVIVLPFHLFTDKFEIEILEEYVSQGGTLVIGFRSGSKDYNAWFRAEPIPGPFRNLAGVEVRKFEGLKEGKVKIKFNSSLWRGTAKKYVELVNPITAKPVAYYNDSKKFYKGHPCITKNKFGKGLVYYVGASLTPESFIILFRKIFKESKVNFEFLGPNIEKIVRKSENNEYKFIINHGSSRNFCIPYGLLDPFEVRLLKKPIR
jgi:beta-galactosidase